MEPLAKAHDADIRSRYPGFHVAFLSLNGSRLYGTHREDSDHDFAGAAIETPEYIYGLKRFEQYEFKANVSEGSIYSLKKFISLLVHNNPTLLCLLYNKHAIDRYGLRDIAYAFPNKRALSSFHGYAKQQLHRISHVTGMHVTRHELIDAYGYDTKYAAHILRLVHQGIEFVTTRRISLPMPKEWIDEYKFIYNGGYQTFDEFEKYANQEIDKLAWYKDHHDLPDQADHDVINGWLIDTYRDFYENGPRYMD